jgi:hypothetical protein
MKKVIIGILVLITLNVNAQKVTDTILIKIDTTTYKRIVSMIRENIPVTTESGKVIFANIISPLQNFTFLQPADKPKDISKQK